MKIGFLRAYDPNLPYQWSLPPLGIGYLAAYAKRVLPQHEYIFEKTIERLLEHKPDLLAISSASENFGQAERFALLARETLGIPSIVGGMHTTSLPLGLPEAFEAGCVGEGEQTFVELAQLYEAKRKPAAADFARIPGLVYHDGPRRVLTAGREPLDMETLPLPDRQMLGEDWAQGIWRERHAVSSRGCPYRCSFCASAKHWGRFRAFSANYVAREIEWLRERYDPEIILFFDDLFIADDERFRRTGALLKERGLLEGIRFRCFARANLIGEAMADFLMEHHFSMLDFGFESNDEEVLRFLGKARVTPETNQQAVDVLRARGASIGGSFIIGCPGEDEQAIGRTWDFMISNAPYFDRMSFGPLQALPGTAIWDWALERGLVSEEMDWSRLAYYEDTFDPERFPLLCDSMEKADFMRWHERIAALCHRINQSGHIRALDEKLARAGGEIARLRGELDSLRGSRLVRGALGLRRALGRVRGARR